MIVLAGLHSASVFLTVPLMHVQNVGHLARCRHVMLFLVFQTVLVRLRAAFNFTGKNRVIAGRAPRRSFQR